MILLMHNNEVVIEIIDLDSKKSISLTTRVIIDELFNQAQINSESILVWCHESLKEHINIEGIKASFHLKNMMLSYGENPYFSNRIGYVEDSPFLKVNKTVKYPTWLMSSQVGAIYASQLLKFKNKIKIDDTFDFVLNAIAKQGMPNGLFCYSEPKLLNKNAALIHSETASNVQLFKFVKLHYKSVWSILLLLNIMINEGKFPIWAFVRNLLKRQQKFKLKFDLEPLEKQVIKTSSTIDVIIPTIGRKEYLHNVLKDLSNQALLPTKVIIVEQNEAINSKTELNFIKNEKWPFSIVHKFIHQTGACNARNLALKETTSNYVFFADDDIRFNENLLLNSINFMHENYINALTLSCLRKDEVEVFKTTFQWSSFGSGCSIVKREVLNKTEFKVAYEHGFGEDADYGMQLRHLGSDVIYYPKEKITHLKAPIGGFREPYKHPWQREGEVQPKPSPTVMLNRLNNSTPQQVLGYRTKLFFKYYKTQKVKNPIAYYKRFKKQWAQSLFWANILKEQDK
ncbi:glycosyltransferase family 2 protein [Hwangdonia seohaensis]|uniref:Glycosyltransferase family A protein n=1 Tax=Hwangdonia seohaensis TaxID=1240727 RepID=A0ABW3RDE9_9FLAO|nr:glycosyltransferase family A protein [Hwangdonia seohaensis]